MHLRLCILLLGLTLTASAQPMPDTLWTRTIPGRVATAMKPTADGGFVLCGQTQPATGDRDGFVLKLDSVGNTEWETTLGESGDDTLNDVRVTRDGGYIAVGEVATATNRTLTFIVRLNAAGDTLWTRRFTIRNSSRGLLVLELGDGSFYLTARADTVDPWGTGNENDVYVYTGWFQLSAAGDALASEWTAGLNGWGLINEISRPALEPLDDHHYWLAGTYYASRPDYNYPWTWRYYYSWHILKMGLDSSLWTHGESNTYLSVDSFCLQKVAPVDDGGCLLLVRQSNASWVRRLSSSGDIQWTHSPTTDVAADFCPAPAGGYAMLSAVNGTLVLIAYDAARIQRWTRSYVQAGWAQAIALEALDDHGYALLATGATDTWIVRTGPDAVLPVVEPPALQPRGFTLTAYPNPFNATTNIVFELPAAAKVELVLFDLTGRAVRTLAERQYQAGRQELALDAGELPSGIYFAHLTAGAFTKTQKLLLVR